MTETLDLHATINGLYAGEVRALWPGKAASAIAKEPVPGLLTLNAAGFEQDAQADLTYHGGVEKAVHHYAAEHYHLWNRELGLEADHFQPGGFGENISTVGLTEQTLCIGDILTLGTATVQISQGRQPCWKLNCHTKRTDMAFLFQKTGRTGWYYRVLEMGSVAAGDQIRLIERINPDWSVEAVTRARLERRIDANTATTLSHLNGMSPGWRAAFAKLSAGDTEEDTAARLEG